MPLRRALTRAFLSPRYPRWLLGIFAAWFALWAISPSHPKDFVLEHILTVVGVVVLVWSRRRFPLSNLSYTLIFLFGCLHVVGAHYTYSEVPYERWLRSAAALAGVEGFDVRASLGWRRNHYDRLVHFAYGLLCSYPMREVFLRIARVRGFWGYYLPLDVTMSFSLIYEILEWGVAVLIAGDVGQSYLGTQGDEWDAQKDMALAALGSLVAMLAAAGVNWRLQRDFAAELADSLRVHDPTPLGEVKVAEMLEEKKTREG